MARPDSPEISYGSDKNGLVWSYLFAPGEHAHSINTDAVVAWLKGEGRTPGTFLWLHFSLANNASERWLRGNLDLPEEFYASLTEQTNSTRLEQEGETLISVIHDAAFDFTFEAEGVNTVNLCMTPTLMVTARLRPVRSVDKLRGAIRAGQPFRSPADLLGQLLHHQADVLMDIIRRSTAQVDKTEDEFLANRATTSRRELGALRRTHVRLQRLLAPEPAALFRLLTRPPLWIGPDDVQELRLAAEEFAAAIGDSASLVERIRLVQEELRALVEERTSRTLFTLTTFTVMALPVNMIAGMFGMNVGGIPYGDHPHGFAIVAGSLVLITALVWWALGRRRD